MSFGNLKNGRKEKFTIAFELGQALIPVRENYKIAKCICLQAKEKTTFKKKTKKIKCQNQSLTQRTETPSLA
jgi:hypothetical protein